jgi:hypothetical protein
VFIAEYNRSYRALEALQVPTGVAAADAVMLDVGLPLRAALGVPDASTTVRSG